MDKPNFSRIYQRTSELIAIISTEQESKNCIHCERYRKELNEIIRDLCQFEDFEDLVAVSPVPARLRGTSTKSSSAEHEKLSEIKVKAQLLNSRMKAVVSQAFHEQALQSMAPETAQAVRALNELTHWFDSLPSAARVDRKYNLAVDAVSAALLETRRYIKHQEAGGGHDSGLENTLSNLWSHAASEIRPYDAELSYLCEVKGHGWSDNTVWERAPFKDLPLKLDQILVRLKNSYDQHQTKSMKMPGKLFFLVVAILAVVVILVLFLGDHLSPIQIQFVRWGCSLAAAVILFYYFSSTAGFSGDLRGYAVSLGGAAAGFTAIYLLLTYAGSGTRLLTIHLMADGKPLRAEFRINVDVPERDTIDKGGERGIITIQVPHGLTSLTSLSVTNADYEQDGVGPYKIVNDQVFVPMKRRTTPGSK